jgi:CBS domain-containing protein
LRRFSGEKQDSAKPHDIADTPAIRIAAATPGSSVMTSSASHSASPTDSCHACKACRKELRVRDIMTRDPVSVTPDITARELARTLADNQISGVPVVDPQDRVIGVVSRTDLLQWCVTGGLGLGAGDLLPSLASRRDRKRNMPDDLGIVEDFMSDEPISCTADSPISAVAQRMAEERVHRVIVLDADGCLLGVVTSLDVLKAYPQ